LALFCHTPQNPAFSHYPFSLINFATRLLEKGANMKTVADLLGHANVQMAMNVYSDVFRF